MADSGGPSRPRGRLGAFSGGPLGIGWAPWAIGAGALALGIFFFMRRGGAGAASSGQQAAAGALPITSQPGAPYPFPTNGQSGGTNPANPSAQQLQQNQLKLQVKMGAGYGTQSLPNVVTTGSGTYAQTGSDYPSLLAAGQGPNVYWQTAPGQFLPVTQQVAATGAASGAPLFLPASNPSAVQLANFAA